MNLVGRAQAYAPHFKGGPMRVEGAVKTTRSLWEKVSFDTGYADAFVLHFGSRQRGRLP